MKKILIVFLSLFAISSLSASYFASGEFEAQVNSIVSYSVNKDGEVQLTLSLELTKLLTSGGHNKDHAKELLGSKVSVQCLVDPKLASVKPGDRVKIIWNYGNGLTPTGVTEFTTWRVTSLDKN